jgi:hypothetical protein
LFFRSQRWRCEWTTNEEKGRNKQTNLFEQSLLHFAAGRERKESPPSVAATLARKREKENDATTHLAFGKEGAKKKKDTPHHL